MNIFSLLKTDDVGDIPAALRELANIVERDIAVRGCGANSIGTIIVGGGYPEFKYCQFDYLIVEHAEAKSIGEFVDWV